MQNVIPKLTHGISYINQRFPGANSISFKDEHMSQLNCRKTVVCEKTDGVRYFLCEVIKKHANNRVEIIWLLVDRRYEMRQVALKYDLM